MSESIAGLFALVNADAKGNAAAPCDARGENGLFIACPSTVPPALRVGERRDHALSRTTASTAAAIAIFAFLASRSFQNRRPARAERAITPILFRGNAMAPG